MDSRGLEFKLVNDIQDEMPGLWIVFAQLNVQYSTNSGSNQVLLKAHGSLTSLYMRNIPGNNCHLQLCDRMPSI